MKKNLKTAVVFIISSVCLCAGAPDIYFTPNRATDQMITDLIEKAKKSVYAASYTMSWKKMMEILRNRHGAIDIKVMLDAEPAEKLPEEMLKIDGKSPLFHPKFIVIDRKTVLAGSGNFTEGSMHTHHNNFLLIENSVIAGFFTRKFLSWWKDSPSEEIYADDTFQIYFSPENDCEDVIKRMISSARNSVRFALYHCTSEDIAITLIRRKLAGVDVCGIVERSSIEPHSVFYSLRDYGCTMKKSNSAGFLHDKFFIIDGETVITGSYNPTAAARRNTECLLVIKDRETAGRFLKEWKRLWRYYSLP